MLGCPGGYVLGCVKDKGYKKNSNKVKKCPIGKKLSPKGMYNRQENKKEFK